MDIEVTQVAPQIHIRFDGRSFNINLNELDVGILSNDNEIRDAVANYLGVPRVKLETFAIDRIPETGNLTLRPEAVFG